MNYNYTEEHYAQMYNNLPEGLKDLVLSGRLAIQVSAIGSRHGLNADQIADLEPAVEDVCLGLITKQQLADNIKNQINTDDRVANRIAAEVEIEILRPFEPELVIARQQKEELDKKINAPKKVTSIPVQKVSTTPSETDNKVTKHEEPQNVSEHATVKAAKDFFSKETKEPKTDTVKTSFDWEADFAKKQEEKNENEQNSNNPLSSNVESKIDKLTESINKLVDMRFGNGENKNNDTSEQMKTILQRLAQAESENEENKKLIKRLQGERPVENIFGGLVPKESKDLNKIQIEKERKVEIKKDEISDSIPPKTNDNSSNIKVVSVVNNIPIEKVTENISEKSIEKKNDVEVFSSIVSKDTIDSIVETRNKEADRAIPSPKKVLSLDELIKKGDQKIKDATPKTATLVFPGLNDEKKIDIKNQAQSESLRQTLLTDVEFLKNREKKIQEEDLKKAEAENTNSQMDNVQSVMENKTIVSTNAQNTDDENNKNNADVSNNANVGTNAVTSASLFKEEILPKTKEERMQALQDKIKSLNKGVSSGGKTNILASTLDPYKL